MYRSKKSGKRSEATAVVPESSVVTMQETTPKPSTDVSIAASVMGFKARMMAPFMLYDATIRQVVPNPAHDRVFRAEVSRVQGIVLRELRRTLEKESVTTPKEMLYGIQKSVMLAYASCAVSSDMEGLLAVSSDEEATCVMARLESFFGDLNASAKAVASVAAVLSTGILRVTFSEACKRLEARLAMEEQSSTKKQRTQEGLLALEATKKNTQDFAQLRGALDTAFEAISTPFAENGITPAVPKSATADTSTAILTVESYYNLLGWVLMIQPERLGLKYSHTTLPAPHQEAEGAAAAAVNLFAKVTSYDPLTGKIVIERTSPASRWGLVVNSSGALIGLENTLRNSTPAGGLLYHALQERKTGLPIFDINGVNVSSVNEKEHKGKKSIAYPETTKAISLDKIRKVLLESNSVISLTVPKMTTLGQPQEVAFDIIPQGGEGASGQQAALILRRSSIEVQWQLNLREHAQGVLVLQGFSDSLPLSEAAENFLSTHRGHLLVVNANGCDTGNNDLLMDVIRSSLYLVLRLRVVDDIEELGADSVSEQEGGTAMMEVEAEALVESAPAAAASHESREAVEDEEAEVAQHRALLEENNIHPDEPLPEVNGMDAVSSSSTKKKGRGKKPLPIEDDTTAEAVAEPEEMPTDAYELEETTTATKKKGRGKKPLPIEDDMTAEAVAEPEEMPTDAYELEETSTATKKKGRGKNDTEEITAKKETPAKKKKLSKKALKEAKKKAREEKKLKKQEMKKMKDNEETLEAVTEPEEMPTDAYELEETSTATKKKGRGKKPLPIEDDMTAEAVAEPEEMPTDAYELEETSTATKKKGRGKKPLPIEDDMTAEAVAEPEEMPTDAYELEETSTATKKKGRGKNDTEEITAKKETPAKKKKLSKKALKEAKKKAREEKKLKKQEMKKMKDNEETLEAVAEPEEEAPEPISSFEEMAKEEGVMDTPIVNLKSQAMAAAEVTKKIKSTKRTPPSPSSPVVEQPPTVIDDAPPVSAAELKNAPPLIFENAVTLDRFDGTHMVLRRPDLKTPWDMKVTFGGDKLVLTRLPPISASLKTHPFLKSLRPDMDGQINWRVDEVNGTDLTTATKALRTKAVESIKKANKISLLLRPMIR